MMHTYWHTSDLQLNVIDDSAAAAAAAVTAITGKEQVIKHITNQMLCANASHMIVIVHHNLRSQCLILCVTLLLSMVDIKSL